MRDNKLIIIGAAIVIGLLIVFGFFLRWERIDAGHAGVQVNLYGDDKGVDNIALVTGVIWYSPIKTMIYEIPTYVRSVVYTADEQEGSETNEEFRVTTKDGLTVRLDVSLNYFTPSENVTEIFKKYRKPPAELEATVLRNYTRKGFNSVASEFTAEGLYENRALFKMKSDSVIRSILEPEGFKIEEIVILNELRLPQKVIENVERKVQARQVALQKEQEVLQKKYDADKKIEEARGEAKSMRIRADAERYAYEQKQRALSPLLIQQQWIEKWNGIYPEYLTTGANGGLMLYKNMGK